MATRWGGSASGGANGGASGGAGSSADVCESAGDRRFCGGLVEYTLSAGVGQARAATHQRLSFDLELLEQALRLEQSLHLVHELFAILLLLIGHVKLNLVHERDHHDRVAGLPLPQRLVARNLLLLVQWPEQRTA